MIKVEALAEEHKNEVVLPQITYFYKTVHIVR